MENPLFPPFMDDIPPILPLKWNIFALLMCGVHTFFIKISKNKYN